MQYVGDLVALGYFANIPLLMSRFAVPLAVWFRQLKAAAHCRYESTPGYRWQRP